MAAGVTGWEAFVAVPAACLLMDREPTIIEATDAFLAATGRDREELLGRYVFDAFADSADGGRESGASLRRVLATGEVDALPPARCDVPVRGGAGAASRSAGGAGSTTRSGTVMAPWCGC